MENLGNLGSPMDHDQVLQPVIGPLLQQYADTPGIKRTRNFLSPPTQPLQGIQHSQQQLKPLMTHPAEKKKINFPPTVVSFNGSHQATITELTDDLSTKWKSKHGIDISINARFGYSQSLLVFTDDSSTFEALLDPIRWPIELKGIEISVKAPRQLPPEYSLIIQQFHKNWIEDEMLNELKRNYVSITKLTRMKMKDDSILNSVRADFKSKDEVTSILRLGKIKIGSMVQPVKPYFLPMRINKCTKCLQHDHETKTCTRPRLCPKCAEEHPLTNGCPNSERCVNCGGGHPSGHSACPVVQEKRRFLVDQAKKRKSELLVATEQRLHQQATGNQINSSYTNKEAQRVSYSQVLMNNQQRLHHQQYQQQGSSLVQNIETILSSQLRKIDERIEKFTSLFSSQLCELEKKLDVFVDQQRKIVKVVNELILPSIQALHRSLPTVARKDDKSNDLTVIMKEINSLVSEHYCLHDTDTQESPTQISSSNPNVF